MLSAAGGPGNALCHLFGILARTANELTHGTVIRNVSSVCDFPWHRPEEEGKQLI